MVFNKYLSIPLLISTWFLKNQVVKVIEGKTTSRNDSTMTGQEDEAPGVNEDEEEEEDGFNDPGREDEKRNK